jgi:hypothetical protein
MEVGQLVCLLLVGRSANRLRSCLVGNFYIANRIFVDGCTAKLIDYNPIGSLAELPHQTSGFVATL